MRSHELKLVAAVTAVVTLALAHSAAAQTYCSTPSWTGTGSANDKCSGDAGDPTYHRREWNVYANISCRDGGWHTAQMFYGNAIVADGWGQCGNQALNAAPKCPAVFTGPSNGGIIGGYHHVTVGVTNRVWHAQSDSCSDGSTSGASTDVTAEECTGAYCCGLEGNCNMVGNWLPVDCRCSISPILVDLNGGGIRLSPVNEGTRFDVDANGTAEQASWPLEGEAFVALDRNGNGRIDSGAELFGSATEQLAVVDRNGYEALRVFDSNADNLIDIRDPVFVRLVLWQDANRDGLTDAGELLSPIDVGITGFSLSYRESRHRDPHGNEFRYRAGLECAVGAKCGPWTYDVFLVRQ